MPGLSCDPVGEIARKPSPNRMNHNSPEGEAGLAVCAFALGALATCIPKSLM